MSDASKRNYQERRGNNMSKNLLCPTEYQEQCRVAEYMRTFYSNVLFFATGNGLKLPIGLAVKFKRMGNNRGVPDLVFPEQRLESNGYCGLFIEMKRTKGGVVSPVQKEWIEELNKIDGVKAIVCKGADEAIENIETLLKNLKLIKPYKTK